MDAPLQGDTGGHIGTAPTNLHHIFPHNPTQTKPTVHAQFPQTILTIPRAIRPNETVGAVPVCPPERPRSGVSIITTHASCARINDGCAPAGRHGRAHRHRPYQTPLYIYVQSHTNKITIYMRFAQTKRVNNPHNTHRGRKCIAHSRPHYLK